MALRSFSQLFAALTTRDAGEPTSANGASSFHLIWDVTAPLDEVSATFELVSEPAVARLYFWALQATFVEGSTSRGGAHLGLQWHPSYPDSRAVNWGGYGNGGELDGSASVLRSTLGNVNTRDYLWHTRVPYRFAINSPAPGRWRGTVTDLATGASMVVRDLYSSGTHLAGPMVWTEAFCRCEASPVVARWSGFRALRNGEEVPVERVRVNYQAYADGGCTNTTVRPDGDGFLQITGTEREVRSGTLLTAPPSG